MATETTDTDDPIRKLEQATERLERAESRVEEFGKEKLQELTEAYNGFVALLDRYEDQVVGDEGDFQTNIEFQEEIAEFTDDLSDEMLLYETFEECDEHLKQRWFKTAHFEYVREQLEPVADLVERLEEYENARAEYRDARKNVRYRIRDLEDEIATLERLERLGEADLDAPTERLREPIVTYNEAVTEAFDSFRREQPARDVLEFLETMDSYPLVPFESPPEELLAYVRDAPAGEERISKLVEYAGYSRSKLEHYVDEPDRLKHVVGGQKTFLSGLDAEPLCISWPPPSAERLQYRTRELTAAVNRLDQTVVEPLRRVAALSREPDYDRLRDSILAREELTDDERERIKSGSIEADLEAARQTRVRLERALDETPKR